ncbi:MAG TPA: alpha/beta fold hydrolase [Planctomycetota bacterium]|nr:alpha/beta fold hydrolase [Planctomycetota bacterium]
MADDQSKPKPRWRRVLRGVLRIAVTLYAGLFLFALFFSNSVIFAPPPSTYQDAPDILKLTTRDGTKISAIYLPNAKAEFTILYSHGNAEDIGEMLPELRIMGAMGYSILAYDYHGYGTSGGKASEDATYQDIDAGYKYLTETRGIAPGKIIVMGHSLGGGPSTDLASREPVGGLILESTFATAFRVLTYLPILPFDKFESVNKLAKVKCPVLIIHGDRDATVPLYHAGRLFANANEPKRLIVVNGAGHMDVVSKAGVEYEKWFREFAAQIK